MTYSVFGGTLNPAQACSSAYEVTARDQSASRHTTVESIRSWHQLTPICIPLTSYNCVTMAHIYVNSTWLKRCLMSIH